MKARSRLQLWSIVLASGLALVGCGEDDDGDGGGTAPVANPESPDGKTVPDSFTNSATNNTDLKAKTQKVQTEIVGDARSDLGMSASLHHLPRMVRTLLQGEDDMPSDQGDTQSGTPDVSDSMEDIGLDDFAEEVKEGADCSGLIEAIEESDKHFDTFFSSLSSQTNISETFDVETDSAQSGMTIEKVDTSGSKYAWHIKVAPSADNPYAFFVPKMELAAGANDNEFAGLMISEMSFDSDAMAEQQGGQQQGGQSAKFDMKTAIEMYANIESKTASVGMTMLVNTSGTDQPATSMNMVSNLTIVAGDNPSFKQSMDLDANDGTTVTDAFVNFELAKNDASSYKLSWNGQTGANTFDQTVIVNRTGNTCKVTSVE